MSKFRTQAPWEFLLSASRNTLQSYELFRLGHAANLRKEIGALLDQWLEENTAAMLARWLIEQRERTLCVPEDSPAADAASSNGVARPITFWRIVSFRPRIPTVAAECSFDVRYHARPLFALFAPTLFSASVR